MRPTVVSLVALFGGLATATLPGYVDKCYDGSTCCSNPTRLLRRTPPPTCTPDKVCCEEKKIIKFKTDGTVPLRCGKSNVKSSTVVVDVAPCQDDSTKDCLHVAYLPFGDGTPYTEYHLQLSSAAIATSNPGGYKFSDTCKFGDGNLSIDCYIPLSRIASEVYGNTNLDFCNAGPLYIAAHAVEGPETCWAGDKLIGANGNWAKYFSGTWSCETICKTECTCQCTPPTPTDKYCEKDTGFAFNPNCDKTNDICEYQLNDLNCNGENWGWFNVIPKGAGTYTFDLVAGAGGNVYNTGTRVGTVTVIVTPTTVVATYQVDQPYAINKAQILLTCSKPVPVPGKKPNPCAPGLYGFESECLNNAHTYSKTLPVPTTDCSGDSLYLIFHAEVTESKPLTDTCPAVGC